MSSPAAWHPDPTGRHEHRYWDGDRWTEHVADAGVATTDPLDGSAATGEGTTTDPSSNEGAAPDPSTGDSPTGGTEPAGSATSDSTAAMPPIEDDTTASSEPASASNAGPPSAPAYGGGTSDGGYGAPAAGGYGASSGGYGAPPSGGYDAASGGFPASTPVSEQPTGGSNGLAVAGMVLGIASLVLSFVGALGRFAGIFMLLVAIAAIVLGGMGKAKVKHVGKGNGMAITGIVTGIIGLIAVGLFFAGGEFWRAFSGEFADLYECLEETGDEEFCQEEFERSILERTE